MPPDGWAGARCHPSRAVAREPAHPAGRADKGYDSQQLIDWIHARQGQANIPARAGNHYPRDFDAHEYQARNLVERFFNRIKHFRRIATRYEKLDVRYVAMLSIALALIWLA